MTIADKAPVGSNNRSAIYKDLGDSEGRENKIYLDSCGIPTIGIDFALASADSQKNLTILPKADIDNIFSLAGLTPWSNEDYSKFQSMLSLSRVQTQSGPVRHDGCDCECG